MRWDSVRASIADVISFVRFVKAGQFLLGFYCVYKKDRGVYKHKTHCWISIGSEKKNTISFKKDFLKTPVSISASGNIFQRCFVDQMEIKETPNG